MPKAKTEENSPKTNPLPSLGFKRPSMFGGSKFSVKQNYQGPKFNASQFRTQHKGGS